jgi:hypothetical protein
VPFTVKLPSWVEKKPSVSETDFQAWEAADDNRKLRILIPSTVFRPGDATASPAPKDFTAYLLGLGQSGAQFTTPKTVLVDGRPATLVTMTTRDPTGGLDGSIGCPASTTVKSACYGPQSDLKLRIASFTIDDRPVLVWLRTNAGYKGEAAADTAFDRMLASLRFAAAAGSSSKPGATSPLDGTWTTSYSRADLAASPLLLDGDEVNDDNWGTETLTFANGALAISMVNVARSGRVVDQFHVQGDIVTVNTGSEKFVARWTISGDTLTLTRDPAVGTLPTPLAIKPFNRG